MADGNWVGDQTKPQLGGVSHLGVREPQRSKVHHFTQPFPPQGCTASCPDHWACTLLVLKADENPVPSSHCSCVRQIFHSEASSCCCGAQC